MSDGTRIEWADATLNYLNGCTVLSRGCTNCYAMKLAGTRLRHHPTREGLTVDTKAGPVWTGDVRPHEPALLQALAWKRGRKIFWNAHGDTFHEKVPDEWIDRLFAVCALTPQHTHMILTKRPARMRDYVTGLVSGERSIWGEGRRFAPGSPAIAKLVSDLGWGRFNHAPRKPLPNIWLGVSVEDQERANERIPDLLATPAAVRFISAEPLLGPIDLTELPVADRPLLTWNALAGEQSCGPAIFAGTARVNWVIAGGESGPRARPMHPEWVRSLRDQCQAAGAAFHFKQWGEWMPVDCVERGDGVTFEPGIPMRRGFARMRRWDGEVARGAGEGESAGGFLTPGTVLALPLGKKRAGRLLDGRTHDEFPQAALETCP